LRKYSQDEYFVVEIYVRKCSCHTISSRNRDRQVGTIWWRVPTQLTRFDRLGTTRWHRLAQTLADSKRGRKPTSRFPPARLPVVKCLREYCTFSQNFSVLCFLSVFITLRHRPKKSFLLTRHNVVNTYQYVHGWEDIFKYSNLTYYCKGRHAL